MDAPLSSAVEVGGVRLAFDRYGAEHTPPMVLLHAAGQDASAWAVSPGHSPLTTAYMHSIFAETGAATGRGRTRSS